MKYYLLPMTSLVILLACFSQNFADGETIVLRVIAQNDDAEEDITGPTAGDVRRTSSDLEIGNENGVEQWVGLRFQNATVPANATINAASIKFTATETDVGNLMVPIVAELSLDPEEFGDDTPITGRNMTVSSVLWDPDPWFPGDCGINTTTTDLSMMVQEVVDQPGWTSGNPMVFIFQNDPMDTSERLSVSFDGNPLQAAELTIDFTPGANVLLGDVNLDGVVNLLDVAPFVDRIATGMFQAEADTNLDGFVNLLDVAPFVAILSG